MRTYSLVFTDYKGNPLQQRDFRRFEAAYKRVYTHFSHAVIWEQVWHWYIMRSDGVMIAMNADCIVKSALPAGGE